MLQNEFLELDNILSTIDQELKSGTRSRGREGKFRKAELRERAEAEIFGKWSKERDRSGKFRRIRFSFYTNSYFAR
jgi:hypothetical protein